jgi:alpha-galactosidase
MKLQTGIELRKQFEKIGLKGKWNLRELWRQKNLCEFSGTFKTEIPYHGVVILRMLPKS